MTTIKATVKGRRLDFNVPADWPDGTEVEIQPLENLRLAQAHDRRLQDAAESVKDLYAPGGTLTEWTALDGEDFDDESIAR